MSAPLEKLRSKVALSNLPTDRSHDPSKARLASRGNSFSLVTLFFGLLIPFLIFGRAAEKVGRHGGFKHDLPILLRIHQSANPTLDGYMGLISQLGDPRLVLFMAAAIVLFLRVKRRNSAMFIFLSIAGAMAFNVLAKQLFQRARPALWVSPLPEFDYGFPSTHAMATMALAAALASTFWPTRARWPALGAGSAYVGAVGISRLYLGVHFPSDVLAGWGASLAWVVGLQLLNTKKDCSRR